MDDDRRRNLLSLEASPDRNSRDRWLPIPIQTFFFQESW